MMMMMMMMMMTIDVSSSLCVSCCVFFFLMFFSIGVMSNTVNRQETFLLSPHSVDATLTYFRVFLIDTATKIVLFHCVKEGIVHAICFFTWYKKRTGTPPKSNVFSSSQTLALHSWDLLHSSTTLIQFLLILCIRVYIYNITYIYIYITMESWWILTDSGVNNFESYPYIHFSGSNHFHPKKHDYHMLRVFPVKLII